MTQGNQLTIVESGFNGLAVEMLTYEYKLLHTIAVVFVPVGLKVWMLSFELSQFVCRHCSIPGASVSQRHLSACLFEDVARIGLLVKPTDALCPDDTLGPMASHKLIETTEAQR